MIQNHYRNQRFAVFFKYKTHRLSSCVQWREGEETILRGGGVGFVLSPLLYHPSLKSAFLKHPSIYLLQYVEGWMKYTHVENNEWVIYGGECLKQGPILPPFTSRVVAVRCFFIRFQLGSSSVAQTARAVARKSLKIERRPIFFSFNFLICTIFRTKHSNITYFSVLVKCL